MKKLNFDDRGYLVLPDIDNIWPRDDGYRWRARVISEAIARVIASDSFHGTTAVDLVDGTPGIMTSDTEGGDMLYWFTELRQAAPHEEFDSRDGLMVATPSGWKTVRKTYGAKALRARIRLYLICHNRHDPGFYRVAGEFSGQGWYGNPITTDLPKEGGEIEYDSSHPVAGDGRYEALIKGGKLVGLSSQSVNSNNWSEYHLRATPQLSKLWELAYPERKIEEPDPLVPEKDQKRPSRKGMLRRRNPKHRN